MDVFCAETSGNFFDKDPIKVDQINQQKSPISDQDIEKFLTENKIQLLATTDFKTAITGADLAIIATPTDYDIETSMFNTNQLKIRLKIHWFIIKMS